MSNKQNDRFWEAVMEAQQEEDVINCLDEHDRAEGEYSDGEEAQRNLKRVKEAEKNKFWK